MQSGQTPILVWWDYLLASEVTAKSTRTSRSSSRPTAPTPAYYDQAISKSAPHPAAARLWEEYLYSAEGQNLFLDGVDPADRAAAAGLGGHGGQDRLRRAARRCRRRRAAAADHRAAERGPGRRRPAVAERHELTAVTDDRHGHGPGAWPGPGLAPPVPAAGRSAPTAARPPLARYAGMLPFTAYVVLGLVIPMIAVVVGAFQDPDTGACTRQQHRASPRTAST